jgi:hypothetical protein
MGGKGAVCNLRECMSPPCAYESTVLVPPLKQEEWGTPSSCGDSEVLFDNAVEKGSRCRYLWLDERDSGLGDGWL